MHFLCWPSGRSLRSTPLRLRTQHFPLFLFFLLPGTALESASGINYSSDRGLTCFLSVSRDELLIFRSIATQFLPLLPRVTSFPYQVSRTLDRFTVRQGRRSFNFFSPMEFDSNTEIETKIREIALQLIK